MIIPSADYVPELTEEELRWFAESKKQSLLSEAAARVGPLQDTVDTGMATEEETAALAEWKNYRVLLMRIDKSTAPDIEWPKIPEV